MPLCLTFLVADDTNILAQTLFYWNQFWLVQQFYCVLLFCQLLLLFHLDPSGFNNSRTDRARNEPFSTKIMSNHIIAAFLIKYRSLCSNLRQTLKQKFCYLYNGILIERSHYLRLIITFVCMLLRGNCVALKKPIVLVVWNLLAFIHQCCWDAEDRMLFTRWAIL